MTQEINKPAGELDLESPWRGDGGLEYQPLLCRVDPHAWMNVAREFVDFNYRQEVVYQAACASRVGGRSEALVLRRKNEVLAAAMVRLKTIPLLGGVAYVSGGPLVRRNRLDDPTRLEMMLEALRDHYVVGRGMTLRIAPSLAQGHLVKQSAGRFQRVGYFPRADLRSYRTLVVDLSAGAERVRAGFHAKWRNGLNAAERAGLAVRQGTSSELMTQFCELYDAFILRKGFWTDQDARFIGSLQSKLAAEDRFWITLAENHQGLLAGHVMALSGDTAVYLLGATSPAGLTTHAAYLLQWQAMLKSMECGLRFYDLGGIDLQENPGVWQFKAGMGGTEILAPGPFELRPANWTNRLILLGERLYRSIRSLRSHPNGPTSRKCHAPK